MINNKKSWIKINSKKPKELISIFEISPNMEIKHVIVEAKLSLKSVAF